jgi:hypothetical protein
VYYKYQLGQVIGIIVHILSVLSLTSWYISIKRVLLAGRGMHTCNSSTWEVKAGLRVQDQPELHSENLSLKKKKKSY